MMTPIILPAKNVFTGDVCTSHANYVVIRLVETNEISDPKGHYLPNPKLNMRTNRQLARTIFTPNKQFFPRDVHSKLKISM